MSDELYFTTGFMNLFNDMSLKLDIGRFFKHFKYHFARPYIACFSKVIMQLVERNSWYMNRKKNCWF